MKPPRNEREHPITAPPSAGADDDPLYDQAVQLVVTNNRASVSLVQRHLRIGYNRASSLLERMESEGLVSPMSVTGNRSILPKIRESSYAYSLAREVSLGGGRITPERVAFERELAFEAQPSSYEVRSMVEDTGDCSLALRRAD